MKKTLLLTIMMLGYMVSQAQINKYGLPFVTNYTQEIIGGGGQTWAGVQDQRGILYFANQSGVLVYDGHYWERISLNNQAAKSVAVDQNGIVHVGMQNDFGRLLPNSNGELVFMSLRCNLPDSLFFGDVSQIYCIKDETFYCAMDYLFIEKDDSVRIVELPFDDGFWSFAMGDSILISRNESGISVFHNDTIQDLDNPYVGGANGIIRLSKDKFLALSNNDMLILQTDTFNYEIVRNPFLKTCIDDALPYSMKRYGDDIIVTFIGGESFVVIDTNLIINTMINQQNGLDNDLVTNSMPTDNLVWATTCNGLSKIELGSAFTRFGPASGLNGYINDIIEYNGVLYLATDGGVFYLENGGNSVSLMKQLYEVIAYSFSEFTSPLNGKKELLASTSIGLLEINGKQRVDTAKRIYSNDVKLLHQSKKHPEYIYTASNSGGIYELTYNKKKRKLEGSQMEISGSVLSIEEDKDGDIWFSIDNQSIVQYSILDKKYVQYVENDNSGLPSVYQVMIKNIDDTLRFCAENGVYEFDKRNSKFILSDILGSAGKDSTHSYYNIVPYENGHVVVNYNEMKQLYWVSIVYKDGIGVKELRKPFNRLRNYISEVAYVDSESNLWLSIFDELYCFKSSRINKEHPYFLNEYNAHVRKVLLNDSIVIFGGTYMDADGSIAQLQGESDIPVLSYNDNSLLFQYSATFFEEEDKMVYSTMLEGADDTWSMWKPGNEYARYGLREGSYTFKVKAKNIYGVESSVAEYSFVIKPPFYRTALAYIFYVIALIAGVFGIVKWNTHRLIEDKKKLERKIAEATEEIRGQNVQLEQQKDEIEKQKDEIQASINYARRIQRALLTPDETIDAIFPDHFLLYKPRNIVSGDYYWIGQFGDNKVCIVADCTGHGVPGGFMSMLGMTNLNYIVGQELRPDEILNKLRKAIITSLRQKDESIVAQMAENGDAPVAVEKKDRSQDGMDVAMYVINEKEMTLSFAGANNPLVLIRDGEVQVIKASKMPVGIYAKLDPFERVDMELKKGDCLYTFSDGFQDQFGQATGRKFMSKHLREVLLENHQKPMAEQKEILNKTYEDWRGPADLQTDDVVLMGVRI